MGVPSRPRSYQPTRDPAPRASLSVFLLGMGRRQRSEAKVRNSGCAQRLREAGCRCWGWGASFQRLPFPLSALPHPLPSPPLFWGGDRPGWLPFGVRGGWSWLGPNLRVGGGWGLKACDVWTGGRRGIGASEGDGTDGVGSLPGLGRLYLRNWSHKTEQVGSWEWRGLGLPTQPEP